MIAIYIRVETVAHRYAVHSINNQLVTFEAHTMVDFKALKARQSSATATKTPPPMAGDKLGALNTAGPAEVRLGLEEKLSGPSGTYSSVSVRLELKVNCAQSNAEVQAATELLYAEGARLLNHYINPAMDLLVEHVKRHER